MDIMSLHYFAEATKELNITKTAQRLFISQQTLSNHIKRLEEHYGVELFYRKPRFMLTRAGEILLEYSVKILQEERNLSDLLDDIKKEEQGTIFFGASSLRLSCLPPILPDFSSRYPKVEIRITAANTINLQKEMLDGNLDFSIAFEPNMHESLYYRKVLNDSVYLCVTDELLTKYYGNDTNRLKSVLSRGVRLKEISKLPFCILNNKMGDSIKKCFLEEDVSPKVYSTCSQIRVSTALADKSLAASFATRTSLIGQSTESKNNLNIYPLLYKGKPLTQNVYICQRKDRYLNTYKQYFLELLEKYFNQLEHKSITELIFDIE